MLTNSLGEELRRSRFHDWLHYTTTKHLSRIHWNLRTQPMAPSPSVRILIEIGAKTARIQVRSIFEENRHNAYQPMIGSFSLVLYVKHIKKLAIFI